MSGDSSDALAVVDRLLNGWEPHQLAEGTWWWGLPGTYSTYQQVERMTDAEIAVVNHAE